jgi:hypothetical protein
MSLGDTPSRSSLSEREGYLAMFYFLNDYFARGGKRDSGMVMLVHDARPLVDPTSPDALRTTDPALWDDWKAAIRRARSEGVPPEDSWDRPPPPPEA